ncbi:MAG: hypothetical protein ABIO49_00265 [Dokdonella sp.]
MKRHRHWMAALLAGLVLAGCVPAPRKNTASAPTTCAILHPVPPPHPFYVGADVDVRVEQWPDLPVVDVVTQLDQRIAANPHDVDAFIQRGYEYAQRNQRVRSGGDFARAQALAPDRTRVYWSQGWARFSLGESVCAIEAWQHAAGMLGGSDMAWPASQHNPWRANVGGDAFWVPYTLAIGYWTAGEHEMALDYYSAAARSFPGRFATLEALNTYSRNWKPREQRAILEVAQAWMADGTRNYQGRWVHHGPGIVPAWIPQH